MISNYDLLLRRFVRPVRQLASLDCDGLRREPRAEILNEAKDPQYG